jgi:hypothetical protein
VVAFAAIGGTGLAGGLAKPAKAQYGGPGQYQYNAKVTVCHKDKVTIRISINAWPAHEAHGDAMGSCTAAARAAKAKQAKLKAAKTKAAKAKPAESKPAKSKPAKLKAAKSKPAQAGSAETTASTHEPGAKKTKPVKPTKAAGRGAKAKSVTTTTTQATSPGSGRGLAKGKNR